MGIEDYLVSSTLLAVLAQRLVRKLCPHCKTPVVADAALLRTLGMADAAANALRFYGGAGCAACSGTGYYGRLGIFELLVVDEAMQRRILGKADANAIRAAAVGQGMRTLWQDGCDKIRAGITTHEEILRVTREEA
jgi:general secretion pathway protein E